MYNKLTKSGYTKLNSIRKLFIFFSEVTLFLLFLLAYQELHFPQLLPLHGHPDHLSQISLDKYDQR